ncbi:MAG: aspartate 1-decarboxylase [Leptospiraceae bacterium]|nr:aspartate 1-decarboxylase [Leptospiraceae bacterium]MDW8306903.1 aspartate 1-decarboxylase [Leptospiraceae bacterium]
MQAKIHRATVTDANLYYEGSLTIDEELLEASGLMEHQKVQVVNINNGQRLETYLIKGNRGSGTVCLNGAAARLGHYGDKIIIIAYAHMDPEEARRYKPKIVLVDDNNRVQKIL